jgi:hypothetical protein
MPGHVLGAAATAYEPRTRAASAPGRQAPARRRGRGASPGAGRGHRPPNPAAQGPSWTPRTASSPAQLLTGPRGRTAANVAASGPSDRAAGLQRAPRPGNRNRKKLRRPPLATWLSMSMSIARSPCMAPGAPRPGPGAPPAGDCVLRAFGQFRAAEKLPQGKRQVLVAQGPGPGDQVGHGPVACAWGSTSVQCAV